MRPLAGGRNRLLQQYLYVCFFSSWVCFRDLGTSMCIVHSPLLCARIFYCCCCVVRHNSSARESGKKGWFSIPRPPPRSCRTPTFFQMMFFAKPFFFCMSRGSFLPTFWFCCFCCLEFIFRSWCLPRAAHDCGLVLVLASLCLT